MAEQEKDVEREEIEQEAGAGDGPAGQNEEARQDEQNKDGLPPVQAEVQDLGGLRRKLVITVPAERIAAKRDQSLNQLSNSAQVPGFRIGRAPRRLIEKRFGSEVKQDVKASMISMGYTEALEQTKLKVLGEPTLDEEKLKSIELPEDGPMTFDFEIEVQPEFELPELDNIPVKRPKVTIDEGHVDRAVDRWRGNFATMETVDGPAKADDVLSTDMTFQIEGGEKHEHAGHSVAVRPQALEGIPLEDLGDKLAGATAGQTITVETTVPQGHPQEDARGKKATFTFVVHQVRRVKLPELDQEFLGKLGFDSKEDFRNWVRGQLEAESGRQERQIMHEQVVNYLLEKTQFELPEGALGQMRDRTLARMANDLMMRGIPRADIEKHIDQLAVQAGEEAVRELKMLFVLAKVSDKLEVTVTEPEVNSLIAQLAAQYNRRPDNLRDELEKRDGIGALVAQIRERKAVDLLLEKAKIEDETPPAEETSGEAKPAEPGTE